MSVKVDSSGRRSIQVEVEVPGTPEQVWEAIATGPGVSAWFVPTEIRDDGTVVTHFGPGMHSEAKVKDWDPPRRFSAESPGLGPNAPALATEWIVEAREGGTCIVRVVHSLFATSDDWDDQLESVESGWPTFFRILRTYLTNFAGQPCATIQLMGGASESRAKAWSRLTGALGLANAVVGERRSTPGGVPRLAGVIDAVGLGQPHVLNVRLDQPAPGIAMLAAHASGGNVFLTISLYLYGDEAAHVVARDEPQWQAWMHANFPFSGEVPAACDPVNAESKLEASH